MQIDSITVAGAASELSRWQLGKLSGDAPSSRSRQHLHADDHLEGARTLGEVPGSVKNGG